MPYVPFYEYFPEIAMRETRTLILPQASNGLPTGEYAFVEMYCDEKGCDCRRVFLNVIYDRKDCTAVIAYGWEDAQFYTEWMRDDSPEVIEELKGPSLNVTSPQSKHAPAVLELFKQALLTDLEYVERIKHHYKIFRDCVDGQSPPKRRRSKIRPGKRPRR